MPATFSVVAGDGAVERRRRPPIVAPPPAPSPQRRPQPCTTPRCSAHSPTAHTFGALCAASRRRRSRARPPGRRSRERDLRPDARRDHDQLGGDRLAVRQHDRLDRAVRRRPAPRRPVEPHATAVAQRARQQPRADLVELRLHQPAREVHEVTCTPRSRSPRAASIPSSPPPITTARRALARGRGSRARRRACGRRGRRQVEAGQRRQRRLRAGGQHEPVEARALLRRPSSTVRAARSSARTSAPASSARRAARTTADGAAPSRPRRRARPAGARAGRGRRADRARARRS